MFKSILADIKEIISHRDKEFESLSPKYLLQYAVALLALKYAVDEPEYQKLKYTVVDMLTPTSGGMVCAFIPSAWLNKAIADNALKTKTIDRLADANDLALTDILKGYIEPISAKLREFAPFIDKNLTLEDGKGGYMLNKEAFRTISGTHPIKREFGKVLVNRAVARIVAAFMRVPEKDQELPPDPFTMPPASEENPPETQEPPTSNKPASLPSAEPAPETAPASPAAEDDPGVALPQVHKEQPADEHGISKQVEITPPSNVPGEPLTEPTTTSPVAPDEPTTELHEPPADTPETPAVSQEVPAVSQEVPAQHEMSDQQEPSDNIAETPVASTEVSVQQDSMSEPTEPPSASPEVSVHQETPEATEEHPQDEQPGNDTGTPEDDAGTPVDEPAHESDPTEGLPCGSADALKGMSVSDSQLENAVDYLYNTPNNKYVPYVATYHPTLTERAVADLLDNCTEEGTHRKYTPAKQVSKVMIPPAFKVDLSPAIWTRAVIDTLGYPFINFTSPSVMEILRGTDPARIRDAYRRVKRMFKRYGLKRPIDTLKEFAGARYRNCILNALVVDAQELYSAQAGDRVVAQVIDPYTKGFATKGSLSVPVDFLTTFYGVLSPVAGSRQYAAYAGKSDADYKADLAATGMPPVYILNPKKVQFRRGPKGSLLHRLFSSKTAPVLVRARVSTHDGGFMIPEKDADRLLSE